MKKSNILLLFLCSILSFTTLSLTKPAQKKQQSFDMHLQAKTLNSLLAKKNLENLNLDEQEDLSDQCDWLSLFRQNVSFIFLQGNALRVDQVYGSDSRGARNGLPFATINGALSAALYGDMVQIYPGTYNESFTIPAGITVVGVNSNSVIISKNVTANTDLVTMGEYSRLENVTLSLTSSNHVQLRGIVFPGTTSATSMVRTTLLTVDNSSAGAGSSNVYGIHSTGTGTPAQQIFALRSSSITVNSTGGGSKRGILINAGNTYNIRDCDIAVNNNGTGSAIGVETNHVSAKFIVQGCAISGKNTNTPSAAADISQTTGLISLGNTSLSNATANGFGFTTATLPMMLVWAYPGQLAKNVTAFMQLNGSASTTAMYARCDQPRTLKSLSIQTQAPPDVSETYTVYQNNVATSFTVSLTNPNTSNVNNTQSITFNTGDTIALQAITSGGKGSTNPVVTMELY